MMNNKQSQMKSKLQQAAPTQPPSLAYTLASASSSRQQV
jgi:hypothetical protein